jgi:putative ABC transport system permease protein
MIHNYLKITFRNLAKYKVHSIINILGLSIGIAISILIMVLVSNELSYDKYNDNWKRIYRVNRYEKLNDDELRSAMTSFALEKKMLEFEEVEEVTRVLLGSHKRVSYRDDHYSADRFFYADPNFFRIFSIPMITGDPDEVLRGKNTVVLTRETAEKYFGRDNPVGKKLGLDNGWIFTVTGICENVPENSHFHFDYLATLNGVAEAKEYALWTLHTGSTYMLVRESADIKMIDKRLKKLVDQYVIPEIEQMSGRKFTETSGKNFFSFYLQPMKDIHFTTDLHGQFEAGIHRGYIYLFTFISLLILVVACINYMNLSTARSATRAREVGLRKVVGATRGQIIIQFMTESILFAFIALFLSMVILELMMRPFNRFSGMDLDIFYLDTWYLVPGLFLGALVIGLISGSYPSFYLSSFNVLSIMKRKQFEGMRNTHFRGLLVLSQFTISIILAICTMIIAEQVKFFRKTNLGFNQHNLLVIQRTYALEQNKQAFKDKINQHSEIISSGVTLSMPWRETHRYTFYLPGKENDLKVMTYWPCDNDFIETMEMYLVEGKRLDPEPDYKCCEVLINETAAKALGLKKPVGQKIHLLGSYENGMEYVVAGVVRDFHFESFQEQIEPVIISPLDEKMHVQYMAVRMTGKDIPATMDYIKKVWSKFVPDQPFDSYFLDRDLDNLYQEEKTTAQIFTLFTFLSILIAVLGLFGLASHSAEQRTREIGIRKAMGASIQRIILMLSAQFTRWVLWASLLAFPIAYLGMKFWLGRYAYHIHVEGQLFVYAAIIAIVIAVLTVSFQAVRSAKANPVEALQYE